jgi:tRNA nucleotidyltransferase (CCA-adding enzyme)
MQDKPYPQAELLKKVLLAAQSVDAGAIAGQYKQAEKIRDAIFQARLEAVKTVLP